MLRLHRLEGFYWVSREGGYARAARAFPYPITQPAVHQQVKKLEAELDVQLFERVHRDRVQLTPAGARLYAFVAPFFEGLPALERTLREGDYGGALTIHAAPLLVRHLMPAWLQRVLARRPGLELHLKELTRLDLEGLRRGEADLLVDHLPEVPKDLATMTVAQLRPFVILHAARGRPRDGRELLALVAQQTFIGYSPGTFSSEQQRRVLSLHGVVPPRVLTAGSTDSILGLVQAGLGYSVIPWLEAQGPKAPGILAIALPSPRVEFPVYAAWRKDAAANPLLDLALETAPKLRRS
jgi:DNA-binding transcriptional LysR family regulator